MNFIHVIRVISIMIFTFHPIIGKSQINDKLKSLSDSISFENFAANQDYPTLIQSIEYQFSITNDSLLIEYTKTTDNTKYENNKSSDTHIGKVAISDIKEIYIYSIVTGDQYYSERYSKFIIETLRQKRLVETSHITHYTNRLYSSFEVPITKHQDTVLFNQIIKLIDEKYVIANNFSEASCETDSIGINLEGTKAINAIYNRNLDSPITLNSNSDIDGETKNIFSEFMVKNNINVLSGTVFISSNDKIEHIACYEYLRLLSFQNPDGIHPVHQNIIKMYGSGLNEESINKFIKLLNEQDWSAGRCNGQKVISAYEFTISAR